jgi:SAP domain-containing new25
MWLTMPGAPKPKGPGRKGKLSVAMTLRAFDQGYWYAKELRAFARKMEIPFASKLRKDQLEAAIKDLLFADGAKAEAISVAPKQGPRDVDQGLRLDLPVIHYTSNKETKLFIEREAAKIQPGFKRASGTRYLLNRWREEQVAAGGRITYRHLVLQAIVLNENKRGPLRVEHGRYMNFISDYMADNKGAAHRDAVRAWHEVKTMMHRKRTPHGYGCPEGQNQVDKSSPRLSTWRDARYRYK